MVEVYQAGSPSSTKGGRAIDRFRVGNLVRAGLTRIADLSERASRGAPKASVMLTHDRVAVSHEGAKGATSFALNDMAGVSEALAAVRGKPVRLVLQGDTGLDLSFRVPNGPLPELKKMIEEEIRYRSPFPSSEVVSAWSASETPTGEWVVRACVILRSVVGPLLAQLQALGLPCVEVERQYDGGAFRARPDWLRTGDQKSGGRVSLSRIPRSALILGLAGVAFVVSTGFQFMAQRSQVQQLEVEAAEARAVIAAAAAERATNATFEALRANSYRALWIVGALTQALPDGVWLDQISLEDGELIIAGYGPSAADVTRLLDGLEAVAEVRFASPVTRDNSQGIERFRIAATIEEGAQ